VSRLPVIPLAAEPVLGPEALRSLRALVGLMIPPSAEYQVPGADDDRIFADIVATLRAHAALARDAIARLDDLAGGSFADRDAAGREAAALDFRTAAKSLAALLVSVTVQCYYRDDRVMVSLGMEPRPPFPKGFEVEQGDWSLLDPVRARPKMYRPAP
jgi:hypothetical protein